MESEPIERLLDYAKDLAWRDYRRALYKWELEYKDLMSRKPKEPMP